MVAYARARFGVAPDASCLLVFGGSQGSRILNRSLIQALPLPLVAPFILVAAVILILTGLVFVAIAARKRAPGGPRSHRHHAARPHRPGHPQSGRSGGQRQRHDEVAPADVEVLTELDTSTSAEQEVHRVIVLARQWAERLGKPVRAWMSDKQDAFVKGIAAEFPDVPAVAALYPAAYPAWRHGLFVAIGHRPNTDLFKGQLDLERHGGHTPTGVLVRVLQRILALTAAVAGCASTGLENIPLLWKPTSGIIRTLASRSSES